jgi:PHD/YefM family antitoxin component YafN of YafNO toxin-antitoxin module
MKIKTKNMVSFTNFTRSFEDYSYEITKSDLLVIKNNKPIFVVMDAKRYERLEILASKQLSSIGFPSDYTKNTIQK